MNLFQITILIIIGINLIRMTQKLRHRILTMQLYLVWIILWLGISALVISPNILNYIAAIVGVGRGVDVAIYVAILLLFYLIYRLILQIEKLDKKVTTLVRKISLHNSTKPKSHHE